MDRATYKGEISITLRIHLDAYFVIIRWEKGNLNIYGGFSGASHNRKWWLVRQKPAETQFSCQKDRHDKITPVGHKILRSSLPPLCLPWSRGFRASLTALAVKS